MKILELSKEAQEVINHYQHLEIGDKCVTTPYYMNLKKERGGLRVMVGKGTSEEIELETRVWAQLKGFDTQKATNSQIRDFMMHMGIGIDCSGFAVYVMNGEFKSKGLRPIWNYLKFSHNGPFATMKRTLRPVENIGAELMTNNMNCIKIENYDDIKPGDLIRAKGRQKNAHHVGIISKVKLNDNDEVEEFEYVNSHRYYEKENGIRIGIVKITDKTKDLLEQEWIDDLDGKNYFYDDLKANFEDNGIRRLKVLAENSEIS